MVATIPGIEAYPKTIMLRDETLVTVRLLREEDKVSLIEFFNRVPEEDRYYLKENVTSPEVVHSWTSSIDFRRVIPIVALAGDQIVADATLHRSRSPARSHAAEIRVVVDPAFREVGLGGRLIREMLDIAQDIGLHSATMELVADRELPAIMAAESVGFERMATLTDRVKDFWGNYRDLIILDIRLEDHQRWWF